MIRRIDDTDRDPELTAALAELDPAAHDPNYWVRFRSYVMGRAASELGARRLMARLTIGDVMASWARALVPTAALAAALAALLLVRGPTLGDPPPLGVEELLLGGLEPLAFPTGLPPEVVQFAAEVF